MTDLEREETGSPRRRDPVFALALACFFLSGFAALLYQTVWTRQFALVFGTADLAVAAVLAAYMGGLAAGAAVMARLGPRVRRPLLAYAVLELAMAVAALLVPAAIRGSMFVAVLLFGGRASPPPGSGLALALFHALATFAIVLVPTACMGATLPLLARAVIRRDDEVASRTGLLYAVNTAGAVSGTIVAGFVLVPSLGLTRTVLVGAAANATVCLLALAMARWLGAAPRAHATAGSVGSLGRRAIVLPVLLLSGVTSFTYEVVWTRLLAHVFGGSIYAFATMLATFLTGIALGAAVAARLVATRAGAVRGLALAEIGMAVGALATFRALDALPGLAVRLGAGRAPDQVGNVALAALVMLPTTLAIGATFPLAIRVLAERADDAAPASARAYAWNTAGAIVGALGAGFLLLPLLGYAGIVVAAAALNLVLAVVVALAVDRPATGVAVAAVLAAVGLAWLPPATPWTLIGTSPLTLERQARPPEFFAVGRNAEVTVGSEAGMLKLRTNGLPEGVMLPPRRYRRAMPDRWLGALPALARPEARRMLVVGLGAGTALEAVARTFSDVDVIELEPEVIAANERFRGRRAVDPLALPGLHLHVNDARGALALTRARWDAIVSQPSHPWTAGASHLYTREFFHLVRDHLTPGGVLVQWIDLDLVDQAMLASLAATLLDAFPEVRIYRPFFRGTAIFLASDTPLAVEATSPQALAASPVELARAGIQTREDVAAALAVDEAGTRVLAAGAPLTTDDRNLLESRSVRVATPLGYRGADQVLAPLDPLRARLGGLDRLYLVRRLLADWDFPRAARLVAALGDPVERATAAGIVALATERVAEGRAGLRAVLADDPGAYEARIALLRSERAALVAGDGALVALAAPLEDPARAVVEGWRQEAARDWGALRALEPRLAAVAPNDAVYGDALRLRAAWRVAGGDRGEAEAALVLLDLVLPMSVDPEDSLLRARAARAAGDLEAAIEGLLQAIDSTTPGGLTAVAARVGAELGTYPLDPALAETRAQIARKLARIRR